MILYLNEQTSFLLCLSVRWCHAQTCTENQQNTVRRCAAGLFPGAAGVSDQVSLFLHSNISDFIIYFEIWVWGSEKYEMNINITDENVCRFAAEQTEILRKQKEKAEPETILFLKTLETCEALKWVFEHLCLLWIHFNSKLYCLMQTEFTRETHYKSQANNIKLLWKHMNEQKFIVWRSVQVYMWRW